MDRVGSDYRRCLRQMKERLGARPLLLQLPMGEEARFSGVIDLIESKARVYEETKSGEGFSIQDVPAEYAEAVNEARTALLEDMAG
jgi:elongation factor G